VIKDVQTTTVSNNAWSLDYNPYHIVTVHCLDNNYASWSRWKCWTEYKLACICSGTPYVSRERGFESVHYETHGLPRHFWWIHLIGLLWVSEFILACQQFVIAGSVAVWYFTRYTVIMSYFNEYPYTKLACSILRVNCYIVMEAFSSFLLEISNLLMEKANLHLFMATPLQHFW